MNDKLNESRESREPGMDRVSLVYLRVSKEGELQRAVAFLRVSADELEGTLALIKQENALQQFADDAGYKIVGRYVEGDGVELSGTALARLMDEVVSEGRGFNTVLVWNWSRLRRNAAEFAELRRNAAEFAELRRTLRENGVDLVSATESARLGALECELDQSDALDEEAAS